MKNHFRKNVTVFVDDIDEAYQIVSISNRKYDLSQNRQVRHDSEWSTAVITDNSTSSNTDNQSSKIFFTNFFLICKRGKRQKMDAKCAVHKDENCFLLDPTWAQDVYV